MTTFTINNKYGIGEIIEDKGDDVVVYFEDEDVTKELMKKFIPIFSSFEEAEAALYGEIIEALENEPKEMSSQERTKVWEDIEEMNRKGALNQRGSSMR